MPDEENTPSNTTAHDHDQLVEHQTHGLKSIPKFTSSAERRKSSAPRPSVTLVEIDTDKELEASKVVTQGALRGLNPGNVLPSPPHPTAEAHWRREGSGDQLHNSPSQASRIHGTRASRYGRAPVDYDMKYHPMDEVTRPNSRRIAQRHPGTGAASTSFKRSFHCETSSESEPSTGRSSDDEDAESDGHDVTTPSNLERVPDPKACRHSTRHEARKSVNYSRKHHPQDYGLPGFQHKARELATQRSMFRRKKKKSKRSFMDPVEVSTDESFRRVAKAACTAERSEITSTTDGPAPASPSELLGKVFEISDDQDDTDSEDDPGAVDQPPVMGAVPATGDRDVHLRALERADRPSGGHSPKSTSQTCRKDSVADNTLSTLAANAQKSQDGHDNEESDSHFNQEFNITERRAGALEASAHAYLDRTN